MAFIAMVTDTKDKKWQILVTLNDIKTKYTVNILFLSTI